MNGGWWPHALAVALIAIPVLVLLRLAYVRHRLK